MERSWPLRPTRLEWICPGGDESAAAVGEIDRFRELRL
jgi:hypothetical protein